MPIVNVYKERELKNAYIGEVYEYSYTFKGKTAAEIGNEFGVLVGGIYTNSNGVTGNSNTECRIKKDIPSLANAERLDKEYHVFCEGHQKSYSLGTCLMCKIFPEDADEKWILDACCYNFEGDGNGYVFFCRQKSNNEQMLMNTRTKAESIEEDDYEWIMEECPSEPGGNDDPGEQIYT